MNLPIGFRFAACAAVVAALCGFQARPVPAVTDDPLRPETSADFERLDSLRKAGFPDSALAGARFLRSRAEESGDPALAAEWKILEGRLLVSLERPSEAEAKLRTAVDAARRHGSPGLVCEGLLQMCFAVDAQGRPPRVLPLLEELVAFAESEGESVYAAQAEMLIARRELSAGHFSDAKSRLERTLPIYRTYGKQVSELNTLHLLGLANAMQGDVWNARAYWGRARSLAQDLGNQMMEAGALTNIASLDYRVGDPAHAVRFWKQAEALYKREGRARSAVSPAFNAAEALVSLGRYTEAESTLHRLLSECREAGFRDLEARQWSGLGQLSLARERPHEAAACFRNARAIAGESRIRDLRASAVAGLTRALAEMDSVGYAVRELSQELSDDPEGIAAHRRIQMQAHLSEYLLLDGQPERALRVARQADAAARELDYRQGRLLVAPSLAEAWREAGRADSAVAVLEQAAELWEAERGLPSDPEWRALRGSQGARVFTDLADLLLGVSDSPDSESIERAFDVLQQYKARTLLERIRGPAHTRPIDADSVAIGLRRVQSEIVRSGELLLDAYWGPRTCLLFAVTRDEARVLRLQTDDDAVHAAVRYTQLASQTPDETGAAGADGLAEAAASVSRTLLAPFQDLLRSHPSLLFAPDGPLNLLPVSALPIAGIQPGDPWEPLLHSHRVEIAPSVSVRVLRQSLAPTGRSDTRSTLLAVGGGYDDDGRRLQGAEAEVQALGRSYRDVEVLLPSRRERDRQRLWRTDLEDYRAMHFAAHTRIDDQRPWRSGIVFPSRTADQSWSEAQRNLVDGMLQAENLVSLHLPVPVVVLSGCESAGGRTLSGEGVQGLTTAFLSAGASVVVATLWPVDDRATAQLVRALYRGLAEGRTVAEALQGAQQEVRARAETSHPFYWAGFVIVGDGDATLPLERRTYALSWTLLALAGVAAAAWWGFRRRRPASAGL